MNKKLINRKYFIHYIEDCTPKIIKFDNKKNMEEWISEFRKINNGQQDSWLDFSFYGKILEKYEE